MEWNLTILRRFRRHWPTVLAAVAMTAVDASVEPVALAAVLAGEGRRHGKAAGAATQDALEKRMRLGAGGGAGALLAEQLLDLLPHVRGEDGLVLAGVHFLLVLDLAQVDGVGQQVVQAALGEPLPAPKVPLARLPALGQPAPLLQLLDHRDQPLVLQV